MRPLPLALLLAACATQPAVPISSLALPRPGAPWPDGVPACVIDQGWESMCAPPIDVRDDQGALIARVDRATYARVRWLRLPPLGGPRDALIEASAAGLRLQGTASIDGQSFTLQHSVELAGPSARIPAGSPVSILGTTGARVAIEVPTGLVRPARAEAQVDCGLFGRLAIERLPAGPPFARPSARSTTLRATPAGPVVLSFEPQPGAAWVWLDQRDGFVQVVGGHVPWRRYTDRTSFVFEGWVPAADVEQVEEIATDWDSGCEPLDLHDTCAQAWASREAAVRSRPAGPAIGTLARGAALVPLEARDGFTAFRLPNDEILAPPGSPFWLADADLERPGRGAPSPDGCP